MTTYVPGEVARNTLKNMLFNKLTGYRLPDDPDATRPGPALTDKTRTIPENIMLKLNQLTVDQRKTLLGMLD